MGVGLDIFRRGYCLKSIDDVIEQTETSIISVGRFSSIAVTLDLVLESLVA